MSTTSVEPMPTPGSEADPYRYGWRCGKREFPDGGYEDILIPLTLEDVLHPQEGDQVTHNKLHQRFCRYLVDVFEARLAHDPTATVLDDVRVAWDVPGLKPHGPDIAVVLGVREQRNWSTFDVGEEGVRPALIIEVTSPETASLDRSSKLEEYDVAGVPLYIIVDAVSRKGQPQVRLLGYHRTPNGYEVLRPDEQGRLWMEPVRLWLAVRENEIACYDEHGNLLGNYTAEAQARAEEAQARAAAEARAQAEAQARAAAEARLRELEAELRRLRGEASE